MDNPADACDEIFDEVNEEGEVVGTVTRDDAHGGTFILHAVVHCVITNAAGEMLLQLRSKNKKIQPGKWDTSVGGHVSSGEKISDALAREVLEEVGIEISAPEFLYKYIMKSSVEREYVYTYHILHEGPFVAQDGEVDALRFWSRDEINAELGTGIFTPNFENEFARFIKTKG